MKNKISGNIRRDSDNYIPLEQMSWHVIVVWECQLKKPVFNETLEQLINQLARYGSMDKKRERYTKGK